MKVETIRFADGVGDLPAGVIMTLRCTHSLINLYENAPREVERIAPADVGVRRLGHFGPFRAEHEARLWPRMAQWLNGLSLPKAA